MFFLKKVILGIAAFVLILWGGAGTQSNSMLLQGGGFIGLIVGLIILYIFIKMAWRAMGCLPSFLVFSGIICFIIYAIGGFNNGFSNLGRNIRSFMGQNSAPAIRAPSSNGRLALMDEEELKETGRENFAENGYAEAENTDYQGFANGQNEAAAPAPVAEEAGPLRKMINALTGSQDGAQAPTNPDDFPVIYGTAKVINGDTLKINGSYFRLYGVDAPESNQTCANGQGRSYRCGAEAGNWLRSWIDNNTLECHVMQQDENGNMVGTCSLGQYDLGAALVNAGWAVAYLKYTDVYYPYEEQARQNRRGLWQGQFYMPWDWRVLQAQKPKIKIIKPKVRKKSLLDV